MRRRRSPTLPERAYYARSKRESERLVLDAHGSGRIWATAVRPDVIYGRATASSCRASRGCCNVAFAPVIGGGRSTLAIVHAANVADGAIRAATHDAAGGRAYNLANDFDVTVRDFFAARRARARSPRAPGAVSLPVAKAALARRRRS